MKLYNIVKVYTSTVGTGTVTLGSAVPSFITFATAGVVNGSTVSYAIEDGNNREVGTGTYTSGAETLTRSVVTSTNSNNLITLSGNAVVFITGLAADLSSDTANVASTLVQRDASGNFAAGAATLSSAVVPLISGGTTASSTLTLQSTSGAGTSDAVIFRTASQLERMRINTAGDVNIGSANNAGNTLRFFDVYNTNTGSAAGVITRLITSDVAGTSTAVGQIIKYKNGTMLIQNSETDAAASMQFFVGASERVRITSGGNVGIGTPSPGARLDVQGGRSYFSANSEAFSIFLRYNASTNGVFLGSPSTDAFQISKSSGAAMLNIDSGGNVGIGTSSPGRLLDVRGLSAFSDGTQGLILGSYTGGSGYSAIYNFGTTPGAANYVFASSTSETILNNATKLVFAIGASEKMRMDSSGRVGIALVPTTSALEVGGEMAAVSAFAALRLMQTVTGTGYRWALNNDGTLRLQYTTNAFSTASIPILIDSSGNVGIGTGSTIRSILNTHVGTITGPAVTAGLTLTAFYSGVTAVNTIDWNYSSQSASPVRLGATFNSDGNGMEMVFYTSTAFNATGSERMRLDKDGRLGIGTTAPDALLTVNTIASFGDGAVTTPSIAHKGDLNTGFWFPAADVIATSTAGSERMRIDSSGNVGIGTTPSYRLHVLNNTDAITSFVHLSKNNGGSADGVYILDDRGFAGVNSGKTFRVLTRDDGGNDTGAIASFENLSQTVLRVGIDGKVGVRTASPATSAALEIAGTTGALLVPRLTTTERDALTAVNGMIIYNTTTNTMQGRINGAWTDM